MSLHRPRTRYIGFLIHSKQPDFSIDRRTMIHVLRQTCQAHTGTVCKAYGIFLTRFQKNAGIIRCHHTAKDQTISLLQSITHLNGTPVHIETIGTSGTMKCLLKKHFSDGPLSRQSRK